MRWCVAHLITIFALASSTAVAPIHDAAKKGDVPAITAALEAGADVSPAPPHFSIGKALKKLDLEFGNR